MRERVYADYGRKGRRTMTSRKRRKWREREKNIDVLGLVNGDSLGFVDATVMVADDQVQAELEWPTFGTRPCAAVPGTSTRLRSAKPLLISRSMHRGGEIASTAEGIVRTFQLNPSMQCS